jgi:glycosyltransferase involved in cell wall biosynthesis
MKPRICFYSVATHLGGGERSMLDLILGLAAAGEFLPIVLVPQPEGPLVEVLKKNKIDYAVLPMPRLFLRVSRERKFASAFYALGAIPALLLYLLLVRQMVRRIAPRLIHTNGIKCHLLGALVGNSLGLPVVWHIRDIIQPGFTRRLLGLCLFLYRPFLVCNSGASALPFASYDRSRVIYNGFAWPEPREAPNLRLKTQAGEKTVILGIVGVLARWKGQDLFLELGARLKAAGVDVRLIVVGGKIYDTVGDATFAEELRTKAEELGISQQTLFTGFVENPLDYVRQFQALVHCSIRPEPFGRVIVEAMSCGVPVIASRAGGVVEIIESGVDGLLYEAGKLDDLFSATKNLLDHPELAAQMAGRARAKAQERFSLAAHVGAIASLYRQIS